MKIVHVVYSLEVGGAEVLVAQLCRAQRANGHDVSICAYSTLGTIGEQLAAEGVSIFVPGEAHPGRTMLRYLSHFRRLKPDVVHCHNPAPTLQAALPARLAGARCVLSTRHSLVEPPYDRNAELKFNTIARLACNWVVGICDITCDNLRGTPLAPKQKIVRVYNGVDPLQRIAPTTELATTATERPFTLLFVGRLAIIKDLKTLIRGFSRAVETFSHLRLWVVGDGPVRSELQALAGDLGLSDRVRFWGQRMDTAGFFSAADCFVMSSVSEGLPMSFRRCRSASRRSRPTSAEWLKSSGSLRTGCSPRWATRRHTRKQSCRWPRTPRFAIASPPTHSLRFTSTLPSSKWTGPT
jgi:glycosyltransferase involved in cell wall biosynthesis